MPEQDNTQNTGTVSGSAQAPIAQQNIKIDRGEQAEEAKLGEINREFQEKSVIKRAKDMGMGYIDISKTPINPDFLKLLSFEEAKKARIVPFYKFGKEVKVAVEDQTKAETIAVLQKFKDEGYQIQLNLASSSGIDEALKLYTQTQQYKKPNIVENVEEKSVKTYEKEIADMSDLAAKLENLTAEEGVNLINIGAMKTNASDVHYEPDEEKVTVRFRIDGMLHKVFKLSHGSYQNLLNQIKYKSKMKLNVSNVPQDGRYDFKYNADKIDVRVSAIPTPDGESLVCRYLVAGKNVFEFAELGFDGRALKKLEKASKISQGMILVTGPTGSGKTTTLYTILNKMKDESNKIITLEDPVEYDIEGVTQSQIDEKRGYTFATGLRSVLRQDPNIVMIGEIRDLQTAETASQAALTGHVLLSTLHTNSAIESIPRLINMGLPPFMVAPTLDTIIAQRLVRRVCPKCHTLEAPSDSERKEFETVFANITNAKIQKNLEIPSQIPEVHGCEHCSNTGYMGRIAINEVLVVNQEIKNLILNNASTVKMIESARGNGMITVREDGFIKVAKGLTTLAEVHRVTDVSTSSN